MTHQDIPFLKILAVSDVELGLIYNSSLASRFPDTNLVIGCGDLPYYYLEFMISILDVPLYYVHGNHATEIESSPEGLQSAPWGGNNLHMRCVRDPSGILLAGIEGSLLYNYGPRQYSQADMWSKVFLMTPALFLNKLRYGRYLDIFVSHASPWKIHDQDDRPHQGIKAFRWFDRVFAPAFHLHGHIHVYRRDTVTETRLNQTCVINTYGYREVDFNCSDIPVQRSRDRDWRIRKRDENG
jgi:hypothetical protein